MIPGADVSNFSGIPSPQVLAEMWSAGFRWFNVGTQRGNAGESLTQQQIDAILAFDPLLIFGPDVGEVNRLTGELRFSVTGVYELLYWNQRDLEKMTHMVSFGLPSRIDVEEPAPPGWTPSAVVARILEAEQVVEAAASVQGIYTSAAKWRELTADSTAFNRHSLWCADYLTAVQKRPPTVADLMQVKIPPAWAREQMRVWQYSSAGFVLTDGTIFNCDLNVWIEDGDWQLAEPDAPAPDPEAERETELYVPIYADSPWWAGDEGDGQRPGRSIDPTPAGIKYTMEARADMQLPDAAVEVEFDVYLRSGRIRFYHGGTAIEAADLGWDGVPRQTTIRAKLTANGELPFTVDGPDPAVIDHLVARGYYV